MADQEEQVAETTPEIHLKDWRLVAFQWLVLLGLTVLLYQVGVAFDYWLRIFPNEAFFRLMGGLLTSWVTALVLLQIYTGYMRKFLYAPHYEGINYVNAGDYDKALEVFGQLSDLFDENPIAAQLIECGLFVYIPCGSNF